MTRPAQRILERARASAWRRVGIPATWSRREETAPPALPGEAGATPDGKNVAAETGEDPGTGRPEGGAEAVTHDSTET